MCSDRLLCAAAHLGPQAEASRLCSLLCFLELVDDGALGAAALTCFSHLVQHMQQCIAQITPKHRHLIYSLLLLLCRMQCAVNASAKQHIAVLRHYCGLSN